MVHSAFTPSGQETDRAYSIAAKTQIGWRGPRVGGRWHVPYSSNEQVTSRNDYYDDNTINIVPITV